MIVYAIAAVYLVFTGVLLLFLYGVGENERRATQ